jgi:hypothetical protein
MLKFNAKIGAIALVVFGIFAGAIAVWDPKNLVVFVTASFGYVFTGVKYLYDNSEKFYMWFQRIRCSMFGLDTSWNFIARINTNREFDSDSFVKRFLDLPGTGNKVVSLPDGTILVSYSDVSFEIHPCGSDVDIHVSNIRVSYSNAETILEKTIGPIIEVFQRGLDIHSAKFFLNVKFLGHNPFLGGYLRRVSAGDLKKFNVSFVVQAEEVTVTKESVELATVTFAELVSASRKILALSPGNS